MGMEPSFYILKKEVLHTLSVNLFIYMHSGILINKKKRVKESKIKMSRKE